MSENIYILQAFLGAPSIYVWRCIPVIVIYLYKNDATHLKKFLVLNLPLNLECDYYSAIQIECSNFISLRFLIRFYKKENENSFAQEYFFNNSSSFILHQRTNDQSFQNFFESGINRPPEGNSKIQVKQRNVHWFHRKKMSAFGICQFLSLII